MAFLYRLFFDPFESFSSTFSTFTDLSGENTVKFFILFLAGAALIMLIKLRENMYEYAKINPF
jgi:hypothetical protein